MLSQAAKHKIDLGDVALWTLREMSAAGAYDRAVETLIESMSTAFTEKWVDHVHGEGVAGGESVSNGEAPASEERGPSRTLSSVSSDEHGIPAVNV